MAQRYFYHDTTVYRSDSTIDGTNIVVVGSRNIIAAPFATVDGTNARVAGNHNIVASEYAQVHGDSNNVSGQHVRAYGVNNVVNGIPDSSNAVVSQNQQHYCTIIQRNQRHQ